MAMERSHHPENLSVYGPMPTDNTLINMELAADSITAVSSLGAAAFLGYVEFGWAIPDALDAFARGDKTDTVFMGAMSMILTTAMWGLGRASQNAVDHMQQLLLNKKFVAVMKREGYDAD
jgi:hypothetical protein